MRQVKSLIAVVAPAVCLGLAPALATPAGLLNKTVRISWFQQTPGLEIGTNKSGSAGRALAITLYVSNAGRVFARVAQRTGQFSDDTAVGPESTAFRSEGSKIVGILHGARAVNGATSITVNFDATFQSCNVEVILGSENGKALEWIGLNGLRYKATGHPTISQQSCAISSGNPFAS